MRPEDDIHDWQALATEQALQLKLERVRRKRAEETLAKIASVVTSGASRGDRLDSIWFELKAYEEGRDE